MASFNRVLVMGNLGQDPELRYTPSQFPVTTLSVATTDYRNNKDGQKQEQTEWHRIVVWGKQAENCEKYLRKGQGVFVEGRLQTRSWEDKQGQKRYTTEIIANTVQFLRNSPSSQANTSDYQPLGEPGNRSQGNEDPLAVSSLPRAGASENPFSGNDAGLDDIPF